MPWNEIKKSAKNSGMRLAIMFQSTHICQQEFFFDGPHIVTMHGLYPDIESTTSLFLFKEDDKCYDFILYLKLTILVILFFLFPL